MSIQQYQIVEIGSTQSSRHLEAIGRINANAVTPEDISARVTGRLVGIDEEKLLVIENGAATKWWWLVHPNLPKREDIVGNLAGFSSREGGKSREMEERQCPNTVLRA